MRFTPQEFSKPEKRVLRNEEEVSFSHRAEKLRSFARTRLEKENEFATFVGRLNAEFMKGLPTEDRCEEIVESNEGKKFFDEGPMVLAAVLELRAMRRG